MRRNLVQRKFLLTHPIILTAFIYLTPSNVSMKWSSLCSSSIREARDIISPSNNHLSYAILCNRDYGQWWLLEVLSFCARFTICCYGCPTCFMLIAFLTWAKCGNLLSSIRLAWVPKSLVQTFILFYDAYVITLPFL